MGRFALEFTCMTNIKKIGKYTVSGVLGQGGMGMVYCAQDPLIGRTVAIKTIRLDILEQPAGKEEALKRFLREAQSVGNLSHPNIVTIYDVGEDDGLIYIAMEYIDGRSLEDMLKQNKKFSLDEIVQLFSQLGSALDYAHQKGIVHRDIKPANILVDRNGKVSIVDFGVARTAASDMTQTGMLMGTPRYMSPEQVMGKKVDNRSDIFSLGAILYELLTQCNPFEGESITTVIFKIMHADLRPLSDFNKQLPKGLDMVVKKALARDADSRYQTCSELLGDLIKQSLSKGQTDTIRESQDDKEETQALGTPMSATPPALKNRKPLFVMLLAMIAVLGAIIGIVWFGNRESPKPATGADSTAVPPAAAEFPTQGKNAPEPALVNAADSAARPGTLPPPDVQKKQPPASPPVLVGKVTPAEEYTEVHSARNANGFEELALFNHTIMVHIPAGDFTIGSPRDQGNDDERPAHKVSISDFWLEKYEVTFEQYDLFCLETGYPKPGDEGWGRGNRPVINVSWNDAQGYCRWLTLKTGRSFRLPSEA